MIKHHSYKIQNVIQKELFAAKHSIKICVAWFTNDLLFQPLLLKLDAGVEVTIITNKDEINCADTNDVDFDEFIRRGGCIYWNERSDKSRLLHHKFCIIDDSVVISGSYNWTNGAEYNDEDITVYSEEPETTKHYSDIFDKLATLLPKSKGEVKITTHKEEQTIDLTQQLQARYCEIGEYIDGLAKVCRTIGNSRLWGFINEQGEEVIPCRYNSVEEFHGGLSFVCLGHYFGAIDNNGTEIIPFQHKSIRWRDNNFIEAYLGNNELCVYDNSGVRIDSNRIIVYKSRTYINKLSLPNKFDAQVISMTFNNGIGIVIFDKTVTAIGRAFANCKELIDITIPNSVTIIEDSAFKFCSSLTSISIPNSVTSIGNEAFEHCTSLSRAIIGNGVNIIGNRAFRNCFSLKDINIPDSVVSIGWYAFSDCRSLITITIGKGVTEIRHRAFYDCSSLKEFTGKYAADNGRCLIINNTIVAYTNASGATYTIPNSVTTIREDSFNVCSSLTSITLSENITDIESGAFYGCRNLKKFNGKYSADDGRCLIMDYTLIAYAEASGPTYIIPNNVANIGDDAFCGCFELSCIKIGDNVISIGWDVFIYSNVKEIFCKATKPPFLGGTSYGDNVFPDTLKAIYVPVESVDAYKNAEVWKEYADHIVGYDFENEKEL